MVDLGFDLYDTVARGRVEALQWTWAQHLVERGVTVVCEAGFWSRAERGERRTWARSVGAAVELRVLDAPLEELRRRIVERNRSLPPGWTPIDPDHLAEWDQQIERPTAEELADYDPPA
jgi:predicted kinase